MAHVPLWMATTMALVVGMVLGSFLNVVVYRVPRGLSVVRPPSFCPACGVPIQSSDNIPVVSWLLLGGRCRSCRAPIPVRYPLVEAGTGALFAVVTLAVGSQWAAVGLCLLAATIGVSALIELDGQHCPASIPVLGTVLGLVALIGAGLADLRPAQVLGAVAGAVLTAVVAVAWTRRRARDGGSAAGMTTAWVLLPAGALLGWLGLAEAVVGGVSLSVLLVVLAGRRRRAASGRSSGQGVSTLTSAGPASAVAVAGVTALLVALAVGATLS